MLMKGLMGSLLSIHFWDTEVPQSVESAFFSVFQVEPRGSKQISQRTPAAVKVLVSPDPTHQQELVVFKAV